VERRYVSSNFFRLLGVRLVEGEWPADNPATADCQMLVSEATVRRLWPEGGAVGALVGSLSSPCRIVGVVTDTRERSLAADPLPTFYRIETGDSGSPALLVRSDLAPDSLVPAVRRAVAQVDPDIPVLDPASMDVMIDRTMAADRYRTIPLALFALASVLLAGVGIYGMLSQVVARQTRALGIRLALGASPGRLKAMVVRDAAIIGGAGLVVGVVAGRALGQILRALLFGVRLTDPLTYVAVIVAVGLVVLVAAWVPARRVTRLDPASVLRTE
jgi:hypothetical protein